jgi:hypothetical protein
MRGEDDIGLVDDMDTAAAILASQGADDERARCNQK